MKTRRLRVLTQDSSIALYCAERVDLQRVGGPANLRILENQEIKSVPYTPISHLYIVRLIGTIRREFLDHTLLWNAVGLERKLEAFRTYYNHSRIYAALEGETPVQFSSESITRRGDLECCRWQRHCRGLVQIPISA